MRTKIWLGALVLTMAFAAALQRTDRRRDLERRVGDLVALRTHPQSVGLGAVTQRRGDHPERGAIGSSHRGSDGGAH